jgi:hypothetical protein
MGNSFEVLSWRVVMKRFVASVFLIVFSMVSASGQSSTQQTGDAKCTAKFAQALSIRGIRLGLSVDELLALFPDMANKQSITRRLEEARDYPYLGRADISLTPNGNISREKLAGINRVSLTIFDDRVVGYSVGYEGLPAGAYWPNLDEWIAKLSETLSLPGTSQWLPRNGGKSLSCDGVIFTAHGGDGGTFGVHTEDFSKQIKEREKAYQEKKRREFKP